VKLELYRNLWGVAPPRSRALAAIEEAGYDGIETVLFNDAEADELREILPRHRLAFKAVLWLSGQTLTEQLESLRVQLERARPLEPASVSIIGGYDCWGDDDVARYLEAAGRMGDATGYSFSHETHRSSILFHPYSTLRLLDR
jgi:sugar phosphate isomerase/epimerase